MPLPAGTQLGPYEILAHLGSGGMGEVYRARDPKLDRDVAIKILAPQLARDPDALARFEREALSVAKLSHPNIFAIYELGRHQDTAFVVSELIDGETLRGATGRRAAAAAARRRLRAADRPWHGRRARPRHRPSRSQARERDDHARRSRQDSRLARAGRRSPRRYLLLRRHALRDVERRARFQGGNRRRHDDGDPHEGSSRSRCDPSRDFSLARSHRPPLSREDARAPLSRIAFHQSDDKGGIFIAGATGESVRRLTDAGFDPAWSPDGSRIAFAVEEVNAPSSRLTISTIYVVDAAGGAPRPIAVEGDAVQPSWSPSGKRIVYWSNTNGQRDLFSVGVDGGARVALTNDVALDWCPVWSGDGRFVYFASDRGGATNIWRIPVDEAGGRATGAPEPVTNGVQASAALPRFSKDGSRMAFRSRVKSVNPVAIPFDPVTARAGTPIVLDASNNIRIPSDVSPDGKQLAFFSLGERQEDAFIGGSDGKGIRRLTDDATRDRSPMFTREGRTLVFYSNRDGNWGPWSVGADGGNLRKIATIPEGCVYVLASPVDDTVVCSGVAVRNDTYVAPLNGDPSGTPVKLPNVSTPAGSLTATAFSPDGRHLAGLLQAGNGRTAGVAVYDLRAHALTTITDDETFGVRWLPDNRRLIYFIANGSQLVVVDTETRQRTMVDVRLPAPSIDDLFAVSRDGRMIYYGATRAEADIWIAERKK